MEGLERAEFQVSMRTVQQAAVTILAPILSVAFSPDWHRCSEQVPTNLDQLFVSLLSRGQVL